MATEISRAAGTATEEATTADTTVDPEDTITTDYVVFMGLAEPIDPTADGGTATGYASEDSAGSPTATEDSAPSQA